MSIKLNGQTISGLLAETKATILSKLGLTTLSGIIKVDGAGNFSKAVEGTDYLATSSQVKNVLGYISRSINCLGTQTYTTNNLTKANIGSCIS